MPLFLGFMIRIESMNELKLRLQKNEFIKVFSRGTKEPQINTIRDTLKVLEIDGLKAILHYAVKIAIANNKVFDILKRNGILIEPFHSRMGF